MLEYLFFNESIAFKFRHFVQERQLAFVESVEPIQQAILIALEEPEDDALWDELDAFYDELSTQDQHLIENEAGELESSRAGIYIQLANGAQTIAQVDPVLLNKILGVLSMDELNSFVESVVKSVESPDDSPICKTVPPD